MPAPAEDESGRRRRRGWRWERWWRWGVGLGLLAALVAIAGPRRLGAAFSRIDPALAVAVVAITIAWLMLAAFKVWILLRRLVPLPFLTFLPVYGTSWATALLLPSQLGDATQVLLLRRHAVPAARSTAAYVVDKAFSLGWLFLVAIYGVGIYTPALKGWWLAILPLLVLVVAAAGAVVLRWLKPRPASWLARLQALVSQTMTQIVEMRRYRGALALNIALTFVKWLITAALYMMAFRAFGVAVPFEAAATLPIMSSLVGYLPVTVGGAGTIELTGVFLFGLLGIDAATTLAVFLFFRVELLAIGLAMIGLGGAADRAATVEPEG